jgi:hypothetical protein
MEELLSQIADVFNLIFGGIARWIERGITNLFGSSNARYIKSCSRPSTPSAPSNRSIRR